ncbi:MAG: mercuric transporter MerT family protein [bacterium]
MSGPLDKENSKFLAIGGVVTALLASSCCIVPVILITFGVSGAWVGNLQVLEPYKPLFTILTLGLLGAGYWLVYFKRPADCDENGQCATPTTTRWTKWALWIGTLLILLALSVDFWAPLFY